MKNEQKYYSSLSDNDLSCYYQKDIFLLQIAVKDGVYDGYVLTQIPDKQSRLGNKASDLLVDLQRLEQEYQLTSWIKINKKKNKKGEIEEKEQHCTDRLMVFVDSFANLVRFLGIPKPEDDDKCIVLGHIEFRCWKDFTSEEPMKVLEQWNKIFIENRMPVYTPSKYARKLIKDVAKGTAAEVFPTTISQVKFVQSAVHGGVQVCNSAGETKENLLGYDIVSAYIYSFIFQKLPMSGLERVDVNTWETYLKKEDVCSIGTYKIEYNSILKWIRCYKDNEGRKLLPGRHVVTITLSSTDLEILINQVKPGIIKVECLALFACKLDYLPWPTRKLCAEQYINKQRLKYAENRTERKQIEYKLQKVMLNSLVFGNSLHEGKKYLEMPPKEAASLLNKERRDRYLAPQWGVMTMSNTKFTVVYLGSQVADWVYSDTDSIYCADDTYNIKLFNQFNLDRILSNAELCKTLGYETEFAKNKDYQYLWMLGTFNLDAKIKRFKAVAAKHYGYETVDGKFVIKKSGCIPENLPTMEEFFSDNYGRQQEVVKCSVLASIQ